MKLKAIVGSLIAITLGMGTVAYASNSYYPPERILCKMGDNNKLTCEGFDHQYLAEDTYTADLTNRDETFMFISGVAYFTPNNDAATVFYTYKNSSMKSVKIKSIRTSIRPDVQNGDWKKFKEDIYTCDTGYMRCPITNLSELKK